MKERARKSAILHKACLHFAGHQFAFPCEYILVVGITGEWSGWIHTPTPGSGIANHIEGLGVDGVFFLFNLAHKHGLNGPVFKVKSKAIHTRHFHTPLIIRTGGEHKFFAFHTILVDFAVGWSGTNKRHIPTSFFQTSLHFTGFKFAFIFKNVFRLLHQCRRVIVVPSVGSGITKHIHSLCLKRFNHRSVVFTKKFCRHGPVSQVESEAIFSCVCHLPLVVGVTGVHNKLLLRDIGLGYFRSVIRRTYEGCIKAAGG